MNNKANKFDLIDNKIVIYNKSGKPVWISIDNFNTKEEATNYLLNVKGDLKPIKLNKTDKTSWQIFEGEEAKFKTHPSSNG